MITECITCNVLNIQQVVLMYIVHSNLQLASVQRSSGYVVTEFITQSLKLGGGQSHIICDSLKPSAFFNFQNYKYKAF